MTVRVGINGFGRIGRDVQQHDSSITVEEGRRNGILRVSKVPIASRDVIGDPVSCIFDPALTQADGTLAKVFGRYDHEWNHTNRLLDLTALVADD
jgi:glyceraldehyde 3-phosphate dehydrogenase